MTPRIHPIGPKKRNQNNPLVHEVVRPHRKRLSRYKLKKQTNIAEKIVNDPFVMSV